MPTKPTKRPEGQPPKPKGGARPGGGRPYGTTKLQPDDETIKDLEGLGRIQATTREGAAFFKVNEVTFIAFLKRHLNAQLAWECSRENGKTSLRRLQFQTAYGDEEKGRKPSVAMQIWLGKQYLKQSDYQRIETNKDDGADTDKPVDVMSPPELQGKTDSEALAAFDAFRRQMARPN